MLAKLQQELGARSRGGLLSSCPFVLRWAIQRDDEAPTGHGAFHYPEMKGAQLSIN